MKQNISTQIEKRRIETDITIDSKTPSKQKDNNYSEGRKPRRVTK